MKIKKKILYFVTGLIFTALAGLITLQMFQLKNAYAQKEQAFNSNVIAAMNKVSVNIESDEAAKSIIETAAFDPLMRSGNVSLRKTGKKPDVSAAAVCKACTDSTKKHTGIVTLALNYNSHKKAAPGRIENADTVNKPRIIRTFSFFSTDGGGYSYSVDSNMTMTVNASSNSNKVNIKISDVVRHNKTKVVSGVVEKLFSAREMPIEKRVDLKRTDSLLSKSFREAGIFIPFSSGLIAGAKDSLAAASNKNDSLMLKQSQLRARLFPSEFINTNNYIAVYFPGSRLLLLKDILPQVLLSLLFIIIIGGCFYYTMNIIIKQKRFAAQVTDFINNMTHEFKTPISTISLASEAIGQTGTEPENARLFKYNDIIREENGRMKMQVEKILQMAALEEGDYELDLKLLDVHSLINNVVKNFSVQAEKSGGRISAETNAEHSFIKGDYIHISNIINNVLDNAVKYSRGAPDINIITRNSGESIVIEVADKGIGIKDEDIKRVFEKYYRVSTGNKHDIKGFGLGLSYVKLMTEAHKGSIEITSKQGRGTSVVLKLPVKLMERAHDAE